MEMEEIRIEETTEIILTYRQPDTVKPVVLRYERELPESMRSVPPEAARRTLPAENHEPPPWRAAIAPPEKQKKSHWGVRLYVGVSLLVILICLGVGVWYFTQNGFRLPVQTPPGRDEAPSYSDGYPYSGNEPEDRAIRIPSYPTGGEVRLALLPAEDLSELTAQEIYDQVTPSVVTVLGAMTDLPQLNSVGTGVIFSSDGYILTNCHVIAGCSSCDVWITDAYGVDSVYNAKVVGYDEDVDLAVLKIDGTGLPVAAFGVSDDLEVGDSVYAIGNPLGVKLRKTVTRGIEGGTGRDRGGGRGARGGGRAGLCLYFLRFYSCEIKLFKVFPFAVCINLSIHGSPTITLILLDRFYHIIFKINVYIAFCRIGRTNAANAVVIDRDIRHNRYILVRGIRGQDENTVCVIRLRRRNKIISIQNLIRKTQFINTINR